MSRRPQSTLSISLFPFLAVLICVMGGLIFLLLATSKRMGQIASLKAAPPVLTPAADVHAAPASDAPRYTAEATPFTKPTDPSPVPGVLPSDSAIAMESALDAARAKFAEDLQELLERRAELQRLVEQRQQERHQALDRQQQAEQQLAKTSADLRLQQQDVQSALERQRTEALAMKQKVAAIDAEIARLQSLSNEPAPSGANPAVDPQQLALLRQRVSELEARLRNEQKAVQTGASKYSILPFDAATGTTRRPIYIECTGESIRFLPEGITLTAADLEGFTEKYNPLIAGTVALVDYWNQHPSSDNRQPYVLMLVRPEGTIAYYYAMRMLGSYQRACGYELLDAQVQLELPPADPGAVAACRNAVDQMLQARERAVAEVLGQAGTGGPRGSRGGSGPGKTSPGAGGNGRPAGPATTSGGSGSGGSGNGSPIATGSPAATQDSWARLAQDASISGDGTSSADPLPPSPAGADPSAPNGNSATADEVTREIAADGTHKLRSRGGFAIDDIQPPDSVDGRSWEHIERFGGRRPAASTSTAASAPNSAAASSSGNPTSSPPPGASSALADRSAQSRTAGRSGSPEGEQVNYWPTSGAKSKRETPNPSERDRLARLARRRWGQSDPSASIALNRAVVIQVDANQIVVADTAVLPAGRGESSQMLFDQLLLALDEQAQTWGRPPAGFFWSPELDFVVSPGGNVHMSRLNAWLVLTGLSIKQKDSLEAVQLPPSPN